MEYCHQNLTGKLSYASLGKTVGCVDENIVKDNFLAKSMVPLFVNTNRITLFKTGCDPPIGDGTVGLGPPVGNRTVVRDSPIGDGTVGCDFIVDGTVGTQFTP